MNSVLGEDSHLGRGIYDVVEVSRLIKRTRSRVEGWTRTGAERRPLLSGELDGLFSFWDLLSLRVIGELVERQVPREEIARGAEYLTTELETHRPFAHERLATVGRGFFAELDSWVDVGMGGQQAFQVVIEPLLEPITFNEAGMAAIWRPHPSVWVNPEVQAGSPCVDGTRIPTQTLVNLHKGGLGIDDLADDYLLSPEQVRKRNLLRGQSRCVNSQSPGPRRRLSIRLLFDENLPWKVAAALEILDFRATYVGNQHHANVPSRGSSDDEVLAYAQKANQVVVTSNHDMILLCAERQQSVFWIDPRGRQFRREELVLLVFKNISDWESRLREATGPVCSRAMRTKTTILSLGEAGRLAHQRMRRIAAAKRRKKSQTRIGPLLSEDGEPEVDGP